MKSRLGATPAAFCRLADLLYLQSKNKFESYISGGLCHDEAKFSNSQTVRPIALKRRGVPASVLDEAARDVKAA